MNNSPSREDAIVKLSNWEIQAANLHKYFSSILSTVCGEFLIFARWFLGQITAPCYYIHRWEFTWAQSVYDFELYGRPNSTGQLIVGLRSNSFLRTRVQVVEHRRFSEINWSICLNLSLNAIRIATKYSASKVNTAQWMNLFRCFLRPPSHYTHVYQSSNKSLITTFHSLGFCFTTNKKSFRIEESFSIQDSNRLVPDFICIQFIEFKHIDIWNWYTRKMCRVYDQNNKRNKKKRLNRAWCQLCWHLSY